MKGLHDNGVDIRVISGDNVDTVSFIADKAVFHADLLDLSKV